MTDQPPYPLSPGVDEPGLTTAGVSLPSPVPEPVMSVDPKKRSWSWRRSASETPPDPEFFPRVEPTQSRPVGMMNRSPLAVGFFATIGGAAAFGLLTAIVTLQSVIVVLVLSLFFALGLNPSVDWLHKRGMRRSAAVLVVTLTLIGALALGIWSVLPLVTEQGTRLILNAPAYLQALRDNPQLASLDAEFTIINRVSEFVSSTNLLNTFFGGLLGAGKVLANVLFSAIITLVLTLYFLASLPAIKEVIYQMAPASRRPRVRYLANEIFNRIGGYLTGMFLVVAMASSVAFVILTLTGMSQYALAITTLVALLWFIPLVGSTSAMLIVAIVAFSTSQTGLIAVILFLLYQQFDAYYIQPRIFSRSVNVPSVVVLVAAMSGGILLGIPGALLAVPTAASLLLLYREVLIPYLNRR